MLKFADLNFTMYQKIFAIKHWQDKIPDFFLGGIEFRKFSDIVNAEHQERHKVMPANRGRIPTVVRRRKKFFVTMRICCKKRSKKYPWHFYDAIAF